MISERELSILRDAIANGACVSEADAISRIESGEPLAYVIGEWYFYGLTFKLNRDCLVPRPDTEHTVEAAIREIPRGGSFIDLCTGSGCIAVSILKNRPDVTAYALDISDGACAMAEENARLNGVSDRLRVINADIFSYKPDKSFSVVTANPPYIRSSVIPTLDAAVKFEPILALDGGEDGMRFYREILSSYGAASAPVSSTFIFEIGYDQRKDIESLSAELGYSYCSVTKDYGGNDRVAVIKK